MSAVLPILLWVLFQLKVNVDGITLDKYYDRNEFSNFYRALTQTQGTYNNNFMLNKIFEGLDSTLNISEKCKLDLLTFREFSVNSSELWSLMMLDSSSSYQPGMFRGNLAHLGDWDQCYSIKSDHLDPAFCEAKVKLPGGRPQSSSIIYHNAPIVFNMCLVSTCTKNDLENILKPWSASHNLTVTFYCHPKKEPSNLFTIITMVITSMFILLLIGSSLYDLWKSSSDQKVALNLWNTFSVQRNLSQLYTSSNPASSETLSALYGIKFLSQLMVIFYHVQAFNTGITKALTNKFDFTEMLESWQRSYYIGLSMSVDTYLVMSGFLICYTSINKPSKYKNIGLYYLHRYIRLTPTLLAVIIVQMLADNQLYSGPQSFRFNQMDVCRTYWWTNLLYINNYYLNLFEMCIYPSWYLAADWQLYLVSPALLFLASFYKDRRVVYSLLSTLFMVGIIVPSIKTYIYSLPADEIFVTSKEDHAKYLYRFYISTDTRFGPWIVGFIVGMLVKTNSLKQLRSNKYYQWACWLISGVFLATCLNLSIWSYEEGERNLFVNAAYNSLKRNLWGISVGWLIFACATGTGGVINRFLSWKAFEPLAKLSYGAYLIHSMILHAIVYESNSPTHYSYLREVVVFISGVVLTYVLATVLYLTVEAPSCNFDKLFLSGTSKAEKKEIEDKTNGVNMNEAIGVSVK